MPLYEPDPAVVRAIEEYHPGLTVRFNDKWMVGAPGEEPDPDFRWMVCQRIYEMDEVADGSRIFVIKKQWFPVLGIGPICQPDNRIIPNLEQNKWENIRRRPQEMLARKIKRREDFADYMHDWAKDRGYWMWKRQYGDFRFPNVDFSSPEDRHKAMQDKLGRQLT